MANLMCKFCGKELKPSDGGVLNPASGTNCPSSPTKKHVAAPNPPHCIYCGYELRNAGTALSKVGGGPACSPSPNKKHALG